MLFNGGSRFSVAPQSSWEITNTEKLPLTLTWLESLTNDRRNT